jgi:hypothetical protein
MEVVAVRRVEEADKDGDNLLDYEEAQVAILAFDRRMPPQCVAPASIATCFATATARAHREVLNWQAFAGAFTPCVLRGLPKVCISTVCFSA